MAGNYVVAVQAPAYPVSPTEFATESAFAEHLKELRRSIGPSFARLVLIAPRLSEDDYATHKHHLGTVSLEHDDVLFIPAHPVSVSAMRFWLCHARAIWQQVKEAVRDAGVVHSGMSTDLWRPLMAMVNFAAWRAGRPVVFFVDIDFRQHSRRFYETGRWSFSFYLINRLVYDPIKWLQVWLAPRMFQLVMLKSASLVRDFGRGRPNVKNFYDAAHSFDEVLPDSALDERMAWMREPGRPLQLVYFGRFASNKGLDRAIEAVRLARIQGEDLRLCLIGAGDCQTALERQVAEADLGHVVTFKPQVRYGKTLFEQLRQAHLSIATPLIEDTPRAAFDSMARGIPIVAFDITYFRDLEQGSGAVALADWPHAQSMAHQLVTLSRDRERLAAMASRGVAFARDNTQAAWLERRTQWMLEFALAPPKSHA